MKTRCIVLQCYDHWSRPKPCGIKTRSKGHLTAYNLAESGESWTGDVARLYCIQTEISATVVRPKLFCVLIGRCCFWSSVMHSAFGVTCSQRWKSACSLLHDCQKRQPAILLKHPRNLSPEHRCLYSLLWSLKINACSQAASESMWQIVVIPWCSLLSAFLTAAVAYSMALTVL